MPDGQSQTEQATAQAEKQLVRGLGLKEATALNMIDMVGIGPFITIPLILAEMGGPQAMLGWMLGALLALSDGMVWSQLGTAMPHAGGTYVFLREAFGPRRWGRLLSFLFIWQMIFRAPLSMASGLIGFPPTPSISSRNCRRPTAGATSITGFCRPRSACSSSFCSTGASPPSGKFPFTSGRW